eukprot:TRINITY_DN211_c0_g1_i2.p1 TRINITY_DN211_c0_g1~~TRINITY_DN211_c0_g1_i2.p1  ORF type:complete len:631 (+),score=113.09 TRINITY_DN211_c0_g1_i2:81-1973(+)
MSHKLDEGREEPPGFGLSLAPPTGNPMTLAVSSPVAFGRMDVGPDIGSSSYTRSLHPFLRPAAAEATAGALFKLEPDEDSHTLTGRKLEALQDLAADFLKMVKDSSNREQGIKEEGVEAELKTQSLFRTVPTSMAKPPLGQNPIRRFGSQRQNSLRFRTNPPERMDIPRAVAIPPNMFSPSMLESPILLQSSQAEPSPTTGTFPLPPFFQGGGPALSSSPRSREQQEAASQQGFMFFQNRQARSEQVPSRLMSPLSGQVAHSPPQQPIPFFNSSISPQYKPSPSRPPPASRPPLRMPQPLQVSDPPETMEDFEKPSEDGYNWRKYGQKQVKGSQYPRSYYKCTHPGCDVKKKVERSKDGKVAENVYKGTHTHPMPMPPRRFIQGSPSTMVSPQAIKATQEVPFADVRSPGGGSADGLDDSATVEITTEMEIRNRIEMLKRELSMAGGVPSLHIPDPPNEPPDLNKGASPLTATPPRSAASSFESGGGTAERKRAAEEGEEVTQAAKKARLIPPPTGRNAREPKVVVQTTSDVDILDDGFRWRKYGQKQVKDNSHPRWGPGSRFSLSFRYSSLICSLCCFCPPSPGLLSGRERGTQASVPFEPPFLGRFTSIGYCYVGDERAREVCAPGFL